MDEKYDADAKGFWLSADGSMMCEAHPGYEWGQCPGGADCPGPGISWVIRGRTLIEDVRHPTPPVVGDALPALQGYDVVVEAQRIIKAIDPRAGATMTLRCALDEAYDAGRSGRPLVSGAVGAAVRPDPDTLTFVGELTKAIDHLEAAIRKALTCHQTTHIHAILQAALDGNAK